MDLENVITNSFITINKLKHHLPKTFSNRTFIDFINYYNSFFLFIAQRALGDDLETAKSPRFQNVYSELSPLSFR